ncbi:uncharacterized protein LOC142318343 [Lycorma delicatula]|uniref:uncharacterized protein LOC142318343 n=1 Tax=Lycorma delicatula TaxID=130591 RepID=UPI003F514668
MNNGIYFIFIAALTISRGENYGAVKDFDATADLIEKHEPDAEKKYLHYTDLKSRITYNQNKPLLFYNNFYYKNTRNDQLQNNFSEEKSDNFLRNSEIIFHYKKLPETKTISQKIRNIFNPFYNFPFTLFLLHYSRFNFSNRSVNIKISRYLEFNKNNITDGNLPSNTIKKVKNIFCWETTRKEKTNINKRFKLTEENTSHRKRSYYFKTSSENFNNNLTNEIINKSSVHLNKKSPFKRFIRHERNPCYSEYRNSSGSYFYYDVIRVFKYIHGYSGWSDDPRMVNKSFHSNNSTKIPKCKEHLTKSLLNWTNPYKTSGVLKNILNSKENHTMIIGNDSYLKYFSNKLSNNPDNNRSSNIPKNAYKSSDFGTNLILQSQIFNLPNKKNNFIAKNKNNLPENMISKGKYVPSMYYFYNNSKGYKYNEYPKSVLEISKQKTNSLNNNIKYYYYPLVSQNFNGGNKKHEKLGFEKCNDFFFKSHQNINYLKEQNEVEGSENNNFNKKLTNEQKNSNERKYLLNRLTESLNILKKKFTLTSNVKPSKKMKGIKKYTNIPITVGNVYADPDIKDE